MARVTTYLNFMGNTEEAFEWYRGIFGTDYDGPIARMGDMEPPPGAPPLAEEDRDKVMHVELPIVGGHVLMATDMLASAGHELRIGNNTTINVECDSMEETRRYYDALSEGSTEGTPFMQMPWGWWGCFLDRYGVRWMFNYPST